MNRLLLDDKVGVDLKTAVVQNLHALRPCARGASFQQPLDQQHLRQTGQHKTVRVLIAMNEEVVSVVLLIGRQDLLEDIEGV